jgi:hypothetical protein
MEAERLVGLWIEDRNAPGPAPRYPGTGPPLRRTVEFRRDGTAVAVADFEPDPCTGRPQVSTTRFAWALTGGRLETTRDGVVDVATVSRLTERELHLVGAAVSGFGSGQFLREDARSVGD